MTFLLLTAVIALANLSLGFVLAVRSGYGPPTLVDARHVLPGHPPNEPEPAQPLPSRPETLAS